MKFLKKIAFALLLVMALLSCGDKNVIFDESVIIPNASWDNQELPYFDVEVEDTLSAYSFYLNIRHLENYIVLAGGVVVHFAYALLLTMQNRKARGNVRYAMTVKEKGVDWASKNMLVIGFIVLAGLGLHLANLWSKMQLTEILGAHENSLGLSPTDGAALIAFTFSKWYFSALYLVWLAGLWFHLTHGVWSMFQTAGWANDTWYPRLKCLSNVVSTLICGGFALVVVFFFLKENGLLCCCCCC